MKWPDRLYERCNVSENRSLATLTTAGAGGWVDLLAEPADREALCQVVAHLAAESIPFRLLGRGSNVLAADGRLPGVVVCTRRLVEITQLGAGRIAADAGAPLKQLVGLCTALGLSGAEGLVGIPGSVGGAAVLNAGGRYGQLADLVESLTVLTPDGRLRRISGETCGFGYRSSNLAGAIVVSLTLQLQPARAEDVRRRTREILEEKRRSQPLRARSCGCVFKNPPGRHAGVLLDKAGLKGARHGDAKISTTHANFMVNTGRASRSDFDALIEKARSRVQECFNVTLEPEVVLW